MCKFTEYVPSANGKRMETLLGKLYLPENKYCLDHFLNWFGDAEAWAKQRTNGSDEYLYVIRYVLNHLCPNLHYFYDAATAEDFRTYGVEYYNQKNRVHWAENTQATLLNEDGSVWQDGIHCTYDEYMTLLAFVEKLEHH